MFQIISSITTSLCFRVGLIVLIFLLSIPVLRATRPSKDTAFIQQLEEVNTLSEGLVLIERHLNEAIANADVADFVTKLRSAYMTKIGSKSASESRQAISHLVEGFDLSSLPQSVKLAFEIEKAVEIAFAGDINWAELELTRLLLSNENELSESQLGMLSYMLGYCNYYLNRIDNSISYASKAAVHFENAKDSVSAMEAYDGLSTSYFGVGNYEMAVISSEKALSLSKNASNFKRNNVYLNYAEALAAVGQIAKGLKQLDIAVSLADNNDPSVFARIWSARASLYNRRGLHIQEATSLDSAAKYYEVSNEMQETMNILNKSANVWLANHNFQKAFFARNKAASINDSLLRARIELNSDKQIAELERDRMAADLVISYNEQQLADARLQNANLFRIMLGVLVLFLLGGVALAYREVRQRGKRNSMLELQVAARTEALNAKSKMLIEQAKELKQSNIELGRFAYIASHDLKTPVRNITSFLNLIERRIDPVAKVQIQEYLDLATANSLQMHKLIVDILDYSRIGSHETKRETSFDVEDLVQQVVRNLDINQELNSVSIEGDLSLTGNEEEFTQILSNLIENGLMYNESTTPTVSVVLTDMGDRGLISITDNGIGIEPEYHERIFELFKRLHTNDKYEGTGVGLSMCKKLIEGMQGTIELDSIAGFGSTFRIMIPKERSVNPLSSMIEMDNLFQIS